MSAKCDHLWYATSIPARKVARKMDLDPRKAVKRCPDCNRWKVVS